MKERQVVEVVRGRRTVDGAGVHLVRVLGHETTKLFDPFLMMDSFDSANPEDYVKGFPLHPHRGIETITYLVQGKITHQDSLGNSGDITDGGTQWMTAGSGILHEEMPRASERMLGLQIWLNLPRAEKMTAPKYFDIRREDVRVVEKKDHRVDIVSGELDGHRGVTPHHVQASVMHFLVREDAEIELPTKRGETTFLFLLEGDALVGGKRHEEKSALLLSDGDGIRIRAAERPLQLMLFQAPPLREPIAWGGPILMNTQEELDLAFEELERGSFIKRGA